MLTLGYFNQPLNNRCLAFNWQSLHFMQKCSGEQTLLRFVHVQNHSLQIENSVTQRQHVLIQFYIFSEF